MSITIKEIEGLLDKKLDHFSKNQLESLLDKKLDHFVKNQLESLFDKKLEPIYNKLSDISRDLSQVRRDLGYDNLKVIRNVKGEVEKQEDEM